jgi:2-acylglycerol O-acyltransferase 2
VAITPGGIAEMYMAGGDADHVYVRSRKGFVAVAVEEGVDIVSGAARAALLLAGLLREQRTGHACTRGPAVVSVQQPHALASSHCRSLAPCPSLRLAHARAQVPVYHFGNSLLLSFGPRCLQRLGRRCRVSLGLLSGAWHLPIPRRVALHMAVGAPVAVSKTPRSDPAFAEVVDETHARFVAALQELYDRHRGAYGWAGRPLVMH